MILVQKISALWTSIKTKLISALTTQKKIDLAATLKNIKGTISQGFANLFSAKTLVILKKALLASTIGVIKFNLALLASPIG
jgi:hypothetical protein